MTRKVTFIHAADLHLGAPMRGLGSLTDEWAARLQSAIPEAYDRVIDAALTRKVDFVIIAGDVFDSSLPSYCDYLHFFEGLQKLDAAGIPTYLVAGNHDPYTSWVRDVGRLPQSAHMLGVGVPTFELFRRDDQPLCLIGGRSYYAQAWPLDEGISDGITRENAIGALSRQHPDADQAPFAIGIIHTGLDIDASKAASDEAELLAQDIDYWACGHLHRHMVRPILDDPRVVFPGCVQGRDIKEAGERGCYLVELEEGVSPRLEFVPTASVSFHSIDVDVSGCRTLSEMEGRIKVALFRENGHDYCSEMVAHVNLVGQTELHEFLRKPDVIAGARKHVNDVCTGFFCDALVDYTSPARSHEQIAEENPLAAEVLQASSAMREGELIDYVQATLVQRGIAVPDALARRMDDFRTAAETLAVDLVDAKGDDLDLPAARAEVARRIDAHLAREGASDQSIYQLGDRLEAKYVEIRKAAEVVAARKQDDRELLELTGGQMDRAERADALTDEVENLQEWRDSLEQLDVQITERREELEGLHRDQVDVQLAQADAPQLDQRLLALTTQDDRSLRDKLEEFAAEREKATRAVDEAQEHSAASSAAYEALLELDAQGASRTRGLASRTAQVLVPVLLTLVFVVAGLPSFMHGRQVGSLSFTVLGAALVVMAFFLAGAAVVALLRPNKDADVQEKRKQDAQWVMLQDKKLLDARQAQKGALEESLHAFLENAGLQAADGSVRQALLLLDDAREERSRLAEVRQRQMALQMHEAQVEEKLAELFDRRRCIEADANLEPDAPVRVLEATLRAKTAERDELDAQLATAAARCSELTKRLQKAKTDRRFDRLKLDYHQTRARLRIVKHDYVVLLLAQRFLGA